MTDERRIRIAITQGDTNGVGLELIFKAFEDPTMLELCTPVIYGSPKVASYYRKAIGSEVNYVVINDAKEAKDGQLNLLAVIQDEVKIDMGQPTVESAEAAVKALAKAVADVRDGLVDALVAGPVNEQGFDFKDLHFHTQTELVGQLLERHARKTAHDGDQVATIHPMRILTEENLRVCMMADGMGMCDGEGELTQARLTETIALLHTSLKRDMDVNNPRVAVLATCAGAGLGERPGKAEQEVIVPVVEQIEKDGRQVFGPYSAEMLMTADNVSHYDAVLAMHRDQVVAPFHLLAQGDGAVLSVGLPIVMVEPGHGACYQLVGKGEASAQALQHSIFLATDAVRYRQRYDEPMGNPLPKLYHERRDESEKVRFRSADRPVQQQEEMAES